MLFITRIYVCFSVTSIQLQSHPRYISVSFEAALFCLRFWIPIKYVASTGSVFTLRVFHSSDTSGELRWRNRPSESFGLVCCVVSGCPAFKEQVSLWFTCKIFWEAHYECASTCFKTKSLPTRREYLRAKINAVLTNFCHIFDYYFHLSAWSFHFFGKTNNSNRKFSV